MKANYLLYSPMMLSCQLVLHDSLGTYIETIPSNYSFCELFKVGDTIVLEEHPNQTFLVMNRHFDMRSGDPEKLTIKLQRTPGNN